MPIYEYRCQTCQGRFQKLVRSFAEPPQVTCPRCQSHHVQRLISQVVQGRSAQDAAQHTLSGLAEANIDENDPQAVARWAKEFGRTLGEDAGSDWDDMVDQVLDEERQQDNDGRNQAGGDDLGWA